MQWPRNIARFLTSLVAATALLASAGAATSSASASGMLISKERLASLPTSGTAWTYLKSQADAAVANMDLDSTPSSASPWLPNYNGTTTVRRPATMTLAAALVYARTGQTSYRDHVVRALRYVIGSENSASTDGTAANDRTLATARSITAFVLAADLVGLDPATTGSRSGYTSTRWDSWLSALRTKTIGEPANCNSIAECSNERGHNWGSFATAARIAIDIHLGNTTDLATAIGRYQRFLGENTSGSQWKASSALDLSYACIPAGSTWTAINPASCGAAKDGMIVEDISRSAVSFSAYDQAGIGYTMESMQGLLLSAIMLERQGHEPFAWGNQALRRVMDWLERHGLEQGNGSSVELHQSWVANYFYGEDYKTVAAGMGRSLGFTDWLFAGHAPADTAPAPDTTAPSAPGSLTAAASDGSIRLDWTANAESDLAGYRIYQSTTSGLTQIGTASGNSFTHTGLDASTTYSYVVKAADGAGNLSEASNQASATTRAPAISLTARGYKVLRNHYVDLNWAGATSSSVTVWRNGTKIATVANTGAYTSNLGKRTGTFRYKVCDGETTPCSAEVTVTVS